MLWPVGMQIRMAHPCLQFALKLLDRQAPPCNRGAGRLLTNLFFADQVVTIWLCRPHSPWHNSSVLQAITKAAMDRTSVNKHACMCAKSLQSCLTLCDPMDCSPPGSSVHGIHQAGILEWVAMPSSRGSSPPRDRTRVSYISYIGRRFLYHWCHLGSKPCE